MDLNKRLLTSKLEILGTTGTYPETDNCYKVKITTSKGSYTCEYFPKPLYHLVETIRKIRGNRKFVDTLITQIEEYKDWHRTDQMNDDAMQEAGESL